jgi:hypothetical protein
MIAYLFANAIAADAGLVPGLAIFGPAFGLPLSVLAGFLERPFVSRAGVTSHALWYSLQANFVSLMVGYLATFVVIPVLMSGQGHAFIIAWPFVATSLSIIVERNYLRLRSPSHCARWGWIIAGNLFTAAVCIAVLVVVEWARNNYPYEPYRLRPYEHSMTIVAVLGSALVFVMSFFATRESRGEDEPHSTSNECKE